MSGPATSQMVGLTAWWLLDLVIDGMPFRYTNRPGGAEVTTAAGAVLVYWPGLTEPRVVRQPGRSRGADISIICPPEPTLEWANLLKRGHRFRGSPGALRQWYDGVLLEQARVIVTGEIGGATYRDALDPIALSLTPNDIGTGLVPTPQMRVDATTWPVSGNHTTDPEVYGIDYPVIIGRPGYIPGVSIDTPSTPALLVEYSDTVFYGPSSKVVIAGHKVAAGSVTLHDPQAGTSAAISVQETEDLLGRTISYVDFSTVTSAEPQPVLGTGYLVAWDQDGGGAVTPDTGAEARGAGDVILWLATQFAGRASIDVATQRAQVPALNPYKLDFSILKGTDPVAFIRRNIAPILPVEEVTTPNGYAWVWRRPWVDGRYVVDTIDTTPGTGNAVLNGAISVLDDDIVNRVVIDYGKAGKSGRYLARVVVSGLREAEEDPSTTDGRYIHDYYAEVSQQRFGVRTDTLALPVVCDATTAVQIGRDLIRRSAWPRREVVVEGPSEWSAREINDCVMWIDTARHANEVAVVRSVQALGFRTVMVLEVQDDLARAMRGTT